MAMGAAGYVVKDDAFEELVTAIRTVMRGKTYIAAPVSVLLTENCLHAGDEPSQGSLEILTKRERDVLRLIAGGLPNKNIAKELGISIRTVEAHRAHLSHKLGVRSAAGLVKYAIAKGLA
jgi:DNA-binding NarL/FixJ family response regulator